MKSPGGETHQLDGQAFQEFHGRHEAWVKECTAEDGVLPCLPLAHAGEVAKLYRLDRDSISAEQEYAELCESFHAMARCDGRPISYRWLDKPLPLPNVGNLEKLLELDWEQKHIDWVRQGGAPDEPIFRCMQAAAGRLVAHREFLEERDQLHREWAELPQEDRPALPLWPPAGLPHASGGERRRAASPELTRFWNGFAEFCSRWQVNRMATWRLPDPDGPKWSAMFTPPELADRGVVQVQTPWHFPLHAAHKMGDLAVAEHAQLAAKVGVDDHGSWETYAHLLPLDYWQRVLVARYSRKCRVAGFMTALEFVLSTFLGVSHDRVKVLRKMLKALQEGRRTSLRRTR